MCVVKGTRCRRRSEARLRRTAPSAQLPRPCQPPPGLGHLWSQTFSHSASIRASASPALQERRRPALAFQSTRAHRVRAVLRAGCSSALPPGSGVGRPACAFLTTAAWCPRCRRVPPTGFSVCGVGLAPGLCRHRSSREEHFVPAVFLGVPGLEAYSQSGAAGQRLGTAVCLVLFPDFSMTPVGNAGVHSFFPTAPL